MKLQDCEIKQLLIRGVSAVVLIGDRAVNGAESAALLAEYGKAFGDNQRPVVYFSVDGWQTTREAKPAETRAAEKIVAEHAEEARAEEADKSGEAPAEKLTPVKAKGSK